MLERDRVFEFWVTGSNTRVSGVLEHNECVISFLFHWETSAWLIFVNLKTGEWLELGVSTLNNKVYRGQFDLSHRPLIHLSYIQVAGAPVAQEEWRTGKTILGACQTLREWKIDATSFLFHELEAVREFAKIFVNSY